MSNQQITSLSFFTKHRTLFLANIVSVFVFCVLAFVRTSLGNLGDLNVFPIASVFGSNTITDIMIGISTAINPTALLVVSILCSALLLAKKKRSWAVFFFITIVSAVFTAVLFKSIFQTARPRDQIVPEIGFGFPSAHATAVAVFFLTFAYAIKEKVHDTAIVYLWMLVSAGLIAITGFSRVYLGVHFISDVFAGFALGIFWATLGILVMEQRKKYE